MRRTKKKAQLPDSLRIGAYIRVSSQRQATEGDSLEAQRNEINKYIAQRKAVHGWSVVSVEFYIDAGRSAKDQKRPELQRLKRDVAEKQIDLVVCFKLDRITRSLLDFVDLWALFETHDVKVISLREDFDTTGPMGEAMLKLIMVFAELEQALIAERTTAIMQDRVERGLWNGGVVYGYLPAPEDSGKLVVDPEWAPIIKSHFFDAFEDLGAAGAVQRHLRQVGINMPIRKSRSGRTRGGQPFTKQQVTRILRNPLYIGRVKWGDSFKDDAHEAIIDKIQFNRVQRKLNETKRTHHNHRYARGRDYPLKGLVRCGCGAMFTPKSATARGQIYHYYSCTRQNHSGTGVGCKAPMIPALALEQAVMDRILSLGTKDEDREKVVEAALGNVEAEANKMDSEVETIRHRLTTVQTEIQNLVGALKAMGAGAVASVKDELVKLEGEKRQLRDRLRAHAEQAAPKTAAAAAAAKRFIDTWSSMGELLEQATPEEQRTILKHYIEVVEITFDDPDGKMGKYALRLFPEVRPLDSTPSRNGNGTPIPGGDGGPVLTEDRIVCQSEQKAPRLGLAKKQRGSLLPTSYGNWLGRQVFANRRIS